MQTSESINEISAALAKAQGAMEAAKKDSQNPHFRSKYADLASIWDACRSHLAQNGIAVVQAPGTDSQGNVTVVTMLTHASGQWMKSEMACKPARNDAQSIGSVVTYLRRYALAAMVGVAPDEDDGEAASGRGEVGGTGMAPDRGRQQQPQTKAPQAQSQPNGETFTLHLGEGSVENFPKTKGGVQAFLNRLEELVAADRWYWEANKETAAFISEKSECYREQVARIQNTNLRMAG